MIRIGQKPKESQPPQPEIAQETPELPVEAPAETPELPSEPTMDLSAPPMGGGLLEPYIVVYLDGSFGPFQCSNCSNFQQPNACSVVSGEIDPAGLCHVFTPMNQAPMEAPMMEEETPDEAIEDPAEATEQEEEPL